MDSHARRELSIFRKFADDCWLDIDPKSIAKRRPPGADIHCKTRSGDAMDFELVEVIDEDIARDFDRQRKYSAAIEDAYRTFPEARRRLWQRAFGHSLFHVVLRPSVDTRDRAKRVAQILDWLETVARDKSGRIQPPSGSEVSTLVGFAWYAVGGFEGPVFDVGGGGAIRDPIEERILGKLSKTYEGTCPVELLAYYERHPAISQHLFPRLRQTLVLPLKDSQMRRVWVYSLADRDIQFVLSLAEG